MPRSNPIHFPEFAFKFQFLERESQNALILLAMSFPGHIFFISLLILTGQMGVQALNVQFLVIYICAAILQVFNFSFVGKTIVAINPPE